MILLIRKKGRVVTRQAINRVRVHPGVQVECWLRIQWWRLHTSTPFPFLPSSFPSFNHVYSAPIKLNRSVKERKLLKVTARHLLWWASVAGPPGGGGGEAPIWLLLRVGPKRRAGGDGPIDLWITRTRWRRKFGARDTDCEAISHMLGKILEIWEGQELSENILFIELNSALAVHEVVAPSSLWLSLGLSSLSHPLDTYHRLPNIITD